MSRCPECEKISRKERAAAKALGERGGVIQDRNGREVRFSDEERKRRSDLAKQLHAEGRFGGSALGIKGGKAPARQRVADAVLEHFRQPEKQELVVKAYESGLRGKSKGLRIVAANAVMKLEKDVDDRMARDRGGAIDPASMTHEELIEFVSQGVEAMLSRGEISLDDLGSTIDLSESSVEELP